MYVYTYNYISDKHFSITLGTRDNYTSIKTLLSFLTIFFTIYLHRVNGR